MRVSFNPGVVCCQKPQNKQQNPSFGQNLAVIEDPIYNNPLIKGKVVKLGTAITGSASSRIKTFINAALAGKDLSFEEASKAVKEVTTKVGTTTEGVEESLMRFANYFA